MHDRDLALEPFGWTERAAEWIALLAAQDTRRVYHRCDASGRHRPLRNGRHLVHRERLGVGMFVLQRPFAKLSASSSASASSSEMSAGQP